MDILEHHFHPNIAVKYGINIAIFLRDIYHWCETNRNNDENFFEGRWWTYQTMRGLCLRHPYWSKNQVEYIIKACKEKGLLLSGHFGEDKFDRTCWYALTDKGISLFTISKSVSEDSEMDFGKNTPSELKIQKCYKDKHKTKDITDIPISQDASPKSQVFSDVIASIKKVSGPDDAAAVRDAIIFRLDQEGFSCQHMAPVSQREETKGNTGRVDILAAKDGVVIGIEVDRKNPREKSIFKLRNFPCDFRVIVLRTGETQTPPAGIDAVIAIQETQPDSLFMKFWEKYPKKLKRADTYKAFQKLHVTQELLEKMLYALEIQTNSAEWQKESGRYIPHATTWLNGRRWEDEAPVHPAIPSAQPLRGEGVTYL